MQPTEPLVALIAGFVSFLAPCVSPLVPGYLSAVSAVEADRLGERGSARRVVLASFPFVLGFTSVFVALGIGAQLIGAGSSATSSCSSGSQDSSSSSSALPSWACCRGRAAVGAGLVQGAAAAVRVLLAARSRSARRRASTRCSRRSSCSPHIGHRRAGGVPARARLARARDPLRARGCDFQPGHGVLFRWLRDHYVAIQFASGSIMVALGLLLFFGRFYFLRIYLNRALERIGIDGFF